MKVCEIDKVCLLVSSQCPQCGKANALNDNTHFWADLNSIWAVGAPECIQCQAKLCVDDYLHIPKKATCVIPLKKLLWRALRMGFLPDEDGVWWDSKGDSFHDILSYCGVNISNTPIDELATQPWMLEERNLLPNEDENE